MEPPNKIAEYKTVTAIEPKALDAIVNSHINDGWEPFHAPYVVPARSGQGTVFQVMVKWSSPGL